MAGETDRQNARGALRHGVQDFQPGAGVTETWLEVAKTVALGSAPARFAGTHCKGEGVLIPRKRDGGDLGTVRFQAARGGLLLHHREPGEVSAVGSPGVRAAFQAGRSQRVDLPQLHVGRPAQEGHEVPLQPQPPGSGEALHGQGRQVRQNRLSA